MQQIWHISVCGARERSEADDLSWQIHARAWEFEITSKEPKILLTTPDEIADMAVAIVNCVSTHGSDRTANCSGTRGYVTSQLDAYLEQGDRTLRTNLPVLFGRRRTGAR